MRFGGVERDRTADLLVANEALSQLSYNPTPGSRPTRQAHGPNVYQHTRPAQPLHGRRSSSTITRITTTSPSPPGHTNQPPRAAMPTTRHPVSPAPAPAPQATQPHPQHSHASVGCNPEYPTARQHPCPPPAAFPPHATPRLLVPQHRRHRNLQPRPRPRHRLQHPRVSRRKLRPVQRHLPRRRQPRPRLQPDIRHHALKLKPAPPPPPAQTLPSRPCSPP